MDQTKLITDCDDSQTPTAIFGEEGGSLFQLSIKSSLDGAIFLQNTIFKYIAILVK